MTMYEPNPDAHRDTGAEVAEFVDAPDAARDDEENDPGDHSPPKEEQGS